MRLLIIWLTLATAVAGFSGCTSDPNSAAIQAMNNPPNACGPGGSRDIRQCDYR
jgi:Na+-translocating ferredoxin:NAD+ oxidoreductase RNF subunit RnfB